MAIAIGNKTASNQNPAGSSQTKSHNMSTGADGTLLVVITMSNSRNFTGCSYGGVTMTQVRNQNMGNLSQRQAMYILQSPLTGVNNIVVTFNGNQWNPTSIFAVSFTGAGGVDTHAGTGLLSTPNSQSLTIVANSIIYASGVSTQGMSPYSIGGSTRPLEFQHNTNRQVGGGLSLTGLSAGAQNVSTKTTSGTVTNSRIAILEASATPSGNSGNFLLCM
tara:strand:+ start:16518 stop:17174 length:657 start_codon:yes stop_codon:yes gene_type:complete